MNYLLLFIGSAITTLSVADLILTVLSPNGSGMITGRFSRLYWRALLNICGKNGKTRFLNYAGAIILFSLILFWVLFIWLGNALTFYADSKSLYDPITGEYVTSFMDKLYYTGYVLSSMGNGDYSPVSPVWKFYVGFISYTGVIYMSLSISFLIPVVEAVKMKRKLAVSISLIGDNPCDILNRYTQDTASGSLIKKMSLFKDDIISTGQNHMTYPIIHYFHSTHRYESLPIYLVILDETISCMLCSVDNLDDRDKRILEELKLAITFYLTTLESAFIEPQDDEPEMPEVDKFRSNFSMRNPQQIRKSFQSITERRKLLLAYLQNDGWQWNDMENNQDRIKLKADENL